MRLFPAIGLILIALSLLALYDDVPLMVPELDGRTAWGGE